MKRLENKLRKLKQEISKLNDDFKETAFKYLDGSQELREMVNALENSEEYQFSRWGGIELTAPIKKSTLELFTSLFGDRYFELVDRYLSDTYWLRLGEDSDYIYSHEPSPMLVYDNRAIDQESGETIFSTKGMSREEVLGKLEEYFEKLGEYKTILSCDSYDNLKLYK